MCCFMLFYLVKDKNSFKYLGVLPIGVAIGLVGALALASR